MVNPHLPHCAPMEWASVNAVQKSVSPALTMRYKRALLAFHFSQQPKSLAVVEDCHWLDLPWTLLGDAVGCCLTSSPSA